MSIREINNALCVSVSKYTILTRIRDCKRKYLKMYILKIVPKITDQNVLGLEVRILQEHIARHIIIQQFKNVELGNSYRLEFLIVITPGNSYIFL